MGDGMMLIALMIELNMVIFVSPVSARTVRGWWDKWQ